MVRVTGIWSSNRSTVFRPASRNAISWPHDKMAITLGGRTVTLYLTPGHTPGTISGIFQVHDHGKPLMVAYSGGTEFNFQNDVAHFDAYLASERKFAAIAAAAGATVVLGKPVGVRWRRAQAPGAGGSTPRRGASSRCRCDRGGALFQDRRRVRAGGPPPGCSPASPMPATGAVESVPRPERDELRLKSTPSS